MDVDLISRARTGDADAFRALVEPHRRELHVHCYRMLGSAQDAEDALQETLLSAWNGIRDFEGRASIRTWPYRIATNRCLNVRRTAQRRPAKAWDTAAFAPPEPTGLGEVPWLEPFPDHVLEEGFDVPLGPEARYEQRESISLAFVTALQLLPPRQTAVLVLRDALGFPAAEVAAILDTTVESVTSALKRARATLDRHRPTLPASTLPTSAAESVLVERFVTAYEAGDVDAVVSLLSDDVFIAMPPVPHEYTGRGPAAEFCGRAIGGRRFRLVPVRANGQPAFGIYLRGPDGGLPGTGLLVVGLAAGAITSMVRFEPTVLGRFGLPPVLDGGAQPGHSRAP